MKNISTTNKVLTIAILGLLILFIFTRPKVWDYKKTQLVEYNEPFNEKHPIIDTIQVLYKNAQPIYIRDNFNIGGHEGIGCFNGGSQMLFIPDKCEKCTKLHSTH